MLKMTFTVDEQTVETLRRVASRLKKPQSVVFREAIRDYADRADRLSDEEQRRMLNILDRVAARKPSRRPAEVAAEIAEVRAVRKSGGRRSRAE